MTKSANDRSSAVNAIPEDLVGKQSTTTETKKDHHHVAQNARAPGKDLDDKRPAEHGGQAGLEPTRYGDWEKKGRCTDF